jgi:hypothetical protein
MIFVFKSSRAKFYMTANIKVPENFGTAWVVPVQKQGFDLDSVEFIVPEQLNM